jgi:hypothetical protein
MGFLVVYATRDDGAFATQAILEGIRWIGRSAGRC